MNPIKPAVMCFSGLDPTGGAGIQADIETLFSIGCHCTPVITALTVQNTANASSLVATEPTLLVQQARAVLEDVPVKCFKVGLLGSVASVEVLHTLFKDYPDIPLVVDPVAVAGGGFEFGGNEVIEAIRNLLLPLTTVLTPNTHELALFAATADTLDASANEVLESGCQYLLVTGTHASSDDVVNRLYTRHQDVAAFHWPRLPESYHGSGCTLASAIAGYLAHESTVLDAVQQAQRFTWEALKQGSRIGLGQHLPNRSFWSKNSLS